ncbi:MAG: tape measure protein [Mesorhizobium sp.]
MAGDTEDLVLSISADTRQILRAMSRLQGETNKTSRAIERQFASAGGRVEQRFQAFGRRLAVSIGSAFASAVTIDGARRLIEAATRIENALKVAGLAGSELSTVYERLFQSATRNAAPLESLVELYGRAALVQKELNVTSEELLGFTDRVALALRVSGQSAGASSGALLQLSQALGSGVVRAEEFNSILEGALPIAQAAAAGLREAGGSVARLRQLVVDGKVSSEAFFRAFEAGAPILEEKVSGAVLTIDQRMTNLQTALIDAARRFNESTGVANTFGAAIDNVASFVNGINFDSLIEEISSIVAAFREGIGQANAFGGAISEITGLESVGSFLTGGAARRDFLGGALSITSTKGVRDRINSAFAGGSSEADADTLRRLREAYGGAAPRTGRLPASSASGFTPVSLSDFAPPAGSKDKAAREKDFEREVRQIRERTEAIQAETVAMAGLNPLIDDYGFAIEKASAQQELLSAAKKQGLEITPALEQQIETLATAYAEASVAAEKLQESQDQVRQAAEDFRDLGRDVLGGFISDLRNGVSAANALQNALSRVADRLLDMALNSIFDGGGNILSMLGFGGGFPAAPRAGVGLYHSGGVAGQPRSSRQVPPGIFAGAQRYHNGGVAGLRPDEVPAILQRGEVITPRGAGGGRSDVHVTVGVAADGNGNLTPFVESVSRRQAAGVVAQAAPTIINASKGATLKEMGRGGADGILGARYGVRPQAARKT